MYSMLGLRQPVFAFYMQGSVLQPRAASVRISNLVSKVISFQEVLLPSLAFMCTRMT